MQRKKAYLRIDPSSWIILIWVCIPGRLGIKTETIAWYIHSHSNTTNHSRYSNNRKRKSESQKETKNNKKINEMHTKYICKYITQQKQQQ